MSLADAEDGMEPLLNYGSSQGAPNLSNTNKNGGSGASNRSFDASDEDNIKMTMVLGSLIYTLDEMRKIARENHLKKDFEEVTKQGRQVRSALGSTERDQHQILLGDYSFIDADGKCTVDVTEQVPANSVDPNVFLDLTERFPSLFGGLLKDESGKDTFYGKNIKLLQDFNKKEDHNIYINNFNAVNNTSEVVYAITALEKAKKAKAGPNQISVVFRGSVYSKDWMQNSTVMLVPIKVRIRGDSAELVEGITYESIPIDLDLAKALQKFTKDGLKDTPIKVHTGFLQYLFAKQEHNSVTKYHAIVNDICNLIEHPNFKRRSELTVTGHSLGGALSTLLAFFLACDKRITRRLKSSRKYVSCISFAAPLVGNQVFQKAFRELETRHKLQHVRITNGRDFVPLLPPLPNYRHTGVQVHLRGKDWFGRSQDAIIKDTGNPKDARASGHSFTFTEKVKFWRYYLWANPLGLFLGWANPLGPFIGCMLTTFPPVILLALYMVLRNILVVIVAYILYLLLKANQRGVPFIREKVVPVVFGSLLIYLLLAQFLNLPSVGDIMPPLPPPLQTFLECWGTMFLVFTVFMQFIMLARQPQHVIGWNVKDDEGNKVSHTRTHSLAFYDLNLKRAQKQAVKNRVKKVVPTLKSSDEIWEHGFNK